MSLYSSLRQVLAPYAAKLNGLLTGWDGTEYNSPGEAVRSQISALHVLIGDEPGTAIDASAIGYGEDSNVEDALDGLNGRLDGLGDGVPTEVRQALLTLLQSAAYAETGLTDEIAVIASWAAVVTAISLNQSSISISGANTNQIVATTTPAGGTVTWASSDTSVATVSNGLVTGVGNGTCTITASCGGKQATCAVTVSGFATLSSISAVYTQGGTVYDTDTLDSLKSDLVVIATYSDSTTRTLSDSDYVLSGTLSVGTSAITVTYGGKTTTFNVTVSEPSHIVPLKGYSLGPASGDSNMWISSQTARACLVNDVGEHPYALKSGVTLDTDYYPIPIPNGVTSMAVTMPSELYVGVRTCAWNGSQYNGSGLSSPWTAAADATFDVSSYNDGTHFALFTFKIGSAGSSSMVNYDMSGVSVSFT